MKHLLLILLFVPFITIGQIKTLDEIKRITSQETFERVLIENGYEKSLIKLDNAIEYVLNPRYNDKIEIIDLDGIANYNVSTKEFLIFFLDNSLNYNRNYDTIFDEVKSNCNYLDVTERMDIALSTYDCLPNGKLGFGKREGSNIIFYFSKKTP